MAESFERIFAIPHFHFDLEWWKTEQGYMRDVDRILSRAMELLRDYPEFTYVLDQATSVAPFLEAHPGVKEEIKKLVAQGRVECVGGTLAAPDENIPTGEALVRQFIYGRRFFEKELDAPVHTAWEIDEFGHPEQMPQILAKSGFRQFVFARGVQAEKWGNHPLEFYWTAPDGSKILTHWLSAHYVSMVPLSSNPSQNRKSFNKELRARMEHQQGNASTPAMLTPLGTDFQIPTPEWMDFVQWWNGKDNVPVEISLPDNFFAAVRKHRERIPEVSGEFNPMLTGCYESRERVKDGCRSTQHEILEAEKLAAVAGINGWMKWPRKKLDRAWENILKNDFHDTVCGTGIDPVYQDTLKRYRDASEAIDSTRNKAVNIMIKKADTAARKGVPVQVFNSLQHERTETVSVEIEKVFKNREKINVNKLEAMDSEGKAVPCQVSGNELLFRASAPGMGYAVYHIRKKAKGKKKTNPLQMRDNVLENEFVRITLDSITGSIASLYDKKLKKEMLDCSKRQGNELIVEEDVGNLWTIQKTGEMWRSVQYPGRIRVLEQGPVRLTVEISGPHKGMKRRQLIRLHAGQRRVDFETRILFRGKDLRIKTAFGVNGVEKTVFETPFCATERGNGHHCAQNWVDMQGRDSGVALLNAGNPGHDVSENVLEMGLMRSISVLPAALPKFILKNLPDIAKHFMEAGKLAARGLGIPLGEWALYKYHGLLLREWASAGVPPSDSTGLPFGPEHVKPFLKAGVPSDAWERGEHTFRYALLSHAGDFADAELTRHGLAFNTPLRAVVVKRSRGELPARHSFVAADPDPGIVMTVLKKQENGRGYIVRAYDAHGRGGRLRLDFGLKLKKCEKLNLVETEKMGRPRVRATRFSDKIAPWEIATYRIEFA